MTGKQPQRIILGQTLNTSLLKYLEYSLLFGLGIIAVLLHARFRSPLNIPGHHGLEFMALLMAGRSVSKIPWASSISSLGIGFILLFPLFGFKDPFMGINYMFPGIVLDLAFNYTRRIKRHFFIVAIIAGAAYLTIPLSRVIISLVSSYPYSSFIKYGYIIPLISFFLFGMAGGFAGYGVSNSISRLLNKKK